MRIKCLIREYYITKSEAVKKEFEEANTVFPFLFSRAFLELKMERATAARRHRRGRVRRCPCPCSRRRRWRRPAPPRTS